MHKYLTLVLVLLIVLSSCSDKSEKKIETLNVKTKVDIVEQEKVVSEIEILKDTVSEIVSVSYLNDSITAVIAKEYFVHVKGELSQDSSFYYVGAYVTLFNRLIDNSDTIKYLLNKSETVKRINLGNDGEPCNRLNIETFNFTFKTPYESFIVIEMVGSSDILVTSLIGLKNNEYEMFFQARGINIRKAILKDSILYNPRFIYPNRDTLKVNIYTKKKLKSMYDLQV